MFEEDDEDDKYILDLIENRRVPPIVNRRDNDKYQVKIGDTSWLDASDFFNKTINQSIRSSLKSDSTIARLQK